MLGLRQEEQGERGPPTWAKGSVLGPSRVPGLQDPAARCTLQKAASAVGCPLPHPGADTVGNPAPSSSSSPAPRPSGFVGLCGGLEGASALPQDRRCGLRGWGGQAPPLALGRCPRCRRALESTGGWGPAVCPGLGSAHRWPHLTSVSGHPLLKPRPDALPGTWHCRQGQQWPVPLPNGRGAPARCLQPADEGGKATEAGEC